LQVTGTATKASDWMLGLESSLGPTFEYRQHTSLLTSMGAAAFLLFLMTEPHLIVAQDAGRSHDCEKQHQYRGRCRSPK
jgi:hypothetical protein